MIDSYRRQQSYKEYAFVDPAIWKPPSELVYDVRSYRSINLLLRLAPDYRLSSIDEGFLCRPIIDADGLPTAVWGAVLSSAEGHYALADFDDIAGWRWAGGSES